MDSRPGLDGLASFGRTESPSYAVRRYAVRRLTTEGQKVSQFTKTLPTDFLS